MFVAVRKSLGRHVRSIRRQIFGKPPKPPTLPERLAAEFGSPNSSVVDLVHWSPGGGVENFGDYLSTVIVTKILADAGLFLSQRVCHPVRLLAIGSILEMARDGDVIWGSGVRGPHEALHKYSRLDVRAVRGPHTREFLMKRGISVPEIYGDPALLIAHLLPGFCGRAKTRSYVFMPNMHDLPLTRGWPNAISPFEPWNVCVDQVVRSEFVAASSLHGLIVAEAFGIPARYVRLSEAEELFKYEDYLLGTGRAKLEFASSMEEALEMGGMPAPIFDAAKLLAAFPHDLWVGKSTTKASEATS